MYAFRRFSSPLNTTFEEYKPMFNKTEINKMMSVDGATSLNIDCLKTTFNSMVESGVSYD